jgi:hypothetical protein
MGVGVDVGEGAIVGVAEGAGGGVDLSKAAPLVPAQPMAATLNMTQSAQAACVPRTRTRKSPLPQIVFVKDPRPRP